MNTDARQEKGRLLSLDRRIKHVSGATWSVPSQTANSGAYMVNVMAATCSCPVVTSVKVTDSTAHDSPEMPALVASSAQRFRLEEVSADKAYLSHANLTAVEAVGAVPFVPFKSNSQGDGPPAWRRLWATFIYKQEEFLAKYHKRSNVESTFSAIKRKFGGAVRSKRFTAQVNEILCKILCHNLTVLVHAMHELGIEPTFGAPAA